MPKMTTQMHNLNETRVTVTTIGVIFGLAGFNHGFFEFLQGNTPTDGLIIQALGEAQRFWPCCSYSSGPTSRSRASPLCWRDKMW
jgi:hypothetical protein